MTDPRRCTCPTKFDADGRIVIANTDMLCPMHGRGVQHCPTCRCHEARQEAEAAIVQTVEGAAKVARDET